MPSPLLPWFNIFIGVVNSNGLVRRASGYLKTEAEGLGRTQSGEEGWGRRPEAAGCHIERDFAALGQGERKRKGGSGSCARLDGRNGSSDDELQLMMQIPGFALPLSFPLSLSLSLSLHLPIPLSPLSSLLSPLSSLLSTYNLWSGGRDAEKSALYTM